MARGLHISYLESREIVRTPYVTKTLISRVFTAQLIYLLFSLKQKADFPKMQLIKQSPVQVFCFVLSGMILFWDSCNCYWSIKHRTNKFVTIMFLAKTHDKKEVGNNVEFSLYMSHVMRKPVFVYVKLLAIAQTCPCNVLLFFTAVKMTIFRWKIKFFF